MRKLKKSALCFTSLLVLLLLSAGCGRSAAGEGSAHSGTAPRETYFITSSVSLESYDYPSAPGPFAEPFTPAAPQDPPQDPSHEPALLPFYTGQVYSFNMAGGLMPQKDIAYLDREGNRLAPDSFAEEVKDVLSGKTRYYSRRTEEGYSLYSLTGQALDSCQGGYAGAVGPLVYRFAEESRPLFSLGGDLFDPLTGKILYPGLRTGISVLSKDRVLLDYYDNMGNHGFIGVLDDRGRLVHEFPEAYAKTDCLPMPPYLILVNYERQWIVLDEDLQVVEAADRSDCKNILAYHTKKTGGMILKLGAGSCDIRFLDQNKMIHLSQETDVMKRASLEGPYINCNGQILWNEREIYSMEGSRLASYDQIWTWDQEDLPILAWKGNTVYLLGEQGEVLKEKNIPGMVSVDIMGWQMKEKYYSCMIAARDAQAKPYNYFMILNKDLEPIAEELEGYPHLVTEGIFAVMDKQTWRIKALINDQGKLIMENLRAVGTGDEHAIAVAKGSYAGLINREGEWIRRYSIYEFPEFTFLDD